MYRERGKPDRPIGHSALIGRRGRAWRARRETAHERDHGRLEVHDAKTVCQLGLLLVNRLSLTARRKQITAHARRRNSRKWEALRS
jgi:hypothetical protein